MKKYIIYSLIMTLTCGLGACNNDEDVDKANSIFSTEEVDRSPFDKWILGNYTHPYNIALKYRMEDNGELQVRASVPHPLQQGHVCSCLPAHSTMPTPATPAAASDAAETVVPVRKETSCAM